jgi:hypothetical protein
MPLFYPILQNTAHETALCDRWRPGKTSPKAAAYKGLRRIAGARDGKDAAYARDYNEKYAERLKTELY